MYTIFFLDVIPFFNLVGMNSWQATPVTPSVAEYLSHLPADSLPLSLHHFLKFSTDTIKRESAIESSPLSNHDDGIESHMLEIHPDDLDNDQVKNISGNLL